MEKLLDKIAPDQTAGTDSSMLLQYCSGVINMKSFKQLRKEVTEATTRKEGKKKSGGLNEKGRKSYERENPGSDLKAPSKKVGNPVGHLLCSNEGHEKEINYKKLLVIPIAESISHFVRGIADITCKNIVKFVEY